MAQVAIDNPDGQRGVVSAQKLLATFTQAQMPLTAGLPPNAEAIVIVATGSAVPTTIAVVGATTGAIYPRVALTDQFGAVFTSTYYYDVSAVVDSEITIQAVIPNGCTCYAYADSGVRFVVNPTESSSKAGVQYVTPVVPSVTAGDHPPNELEYTSGAVTANTTAVNAPGAGERLRVFSAWLTANTTGNGNMGSTAGATLIACPQSGHGTTTFGPSGLPLPANAGIQVFTSGGGIAIYYGVTYTVETL